MNEEQLKQLSSQLNIDFLVLQKIFNKFRPKDRTELLKITNEIVGLQGQLNTQDIDSVIEYYESTKQPVTNTQNETLEQPELVQPISVQLEENQTPEIPSQQVEQTGQPQLDPQVQRQSASINFEDKFGQGYQFRPQGNNDLTGQCAWFAQQVTTLPDGSNWTIGNTIGEKQRQLQGHRQSGNAFLRGEAQPEVGNSVVLDTGTQYGHVAVISEVLPDGRVRLTESNWDNDQRVRHDRIIDPNDQTVVGFVRSKPTREFKVEPSKTSLDTPETKDVFQEKIDAPQGKQELPIEQQPVKQENISLPEQVALDRNPIVDNQVDTEGEPKTVQQIQDDFKSQIAPENKNVGFLDIFSKNGQVIKPNQIQNSIQKASVPDIKQPTFQQKSQTIQVRQPQPAVPQSATTQVRPLQQAAQVIQPKQPIIPQRSVVQQQTPVFRNPQPIQRQVRTIALPTIPQRVPIPQKQPQQQSQLKSFINRVTNLFRR